MTGTNLLRLLQQTASSAPMMQRTSCRLSGKSLTGQRLGLKSRREGVASSRQALLMVTASVSAAGMLVAIVLPALQLQKLRAVLGTGKKTRLHHQPGSCCKPSLLMRCRVKNTSRAQQVQHAQRQGLQRELEDALLEAKASTDTCAWQLPPAALHSCCLSGAMPQSR